MEIALSARSTTGDDKPGDNHPALLNDNHTEGDPNSDYLNLNFNAAAQQADGEVVANNAESDANETD